MNLWQTLRGTRAAPVDAERATLTDYLKWAMSDAALGALQTTMPGEKAEAIANNFCGYVTSGLHRNPIVWGLESVRVLLFSEARFKFRQLRDGRPGQLFGTPDLGLLERPWPGGTTGDLLAIMILDADFAGNAYVTRVGDELVRLRPDWVDIVLDVRSTDYGPVGKKKLGYAYWEGGRDTGVAPVNFPADEVVHFAPMRDPLASYRGMSWLTPVLREMQTDDVVAQHKKKFFENAATPNLAVSLKEITDPDLFQAFVDKMDEQHVGVDNAYKTLYLGAGADVTVVGAQALDFKSIQGTIETRLALASRVPAVVAGISEGLQGSSLNQGNYSQARRQLADGLLRPYWRNVAGSFETLVPAPAGAELWYDDRDIAFLRDDAKEAAEVLALQAQAIRQLADGGYDPDSARDAVVAGDLAQLSHTGLLSVQLNKPGAQDQPPPSMPMNGKQPAMPMSPGGA